MNSGSSGLPGPSGPADRSRLNVSSQKFMYISSTVLQYFCYYGIGDHEYVMIRVVPEDLLSITTIILADTTVNNPSYD